MIKKLLFISLIFSVSGLVSFGQSLEKIKSHRLLRKTTVTVLEAQKSLREAKNFKGDFAKAVAHQRFAKKLFSRGITDKAVMHSKLSRELAFKVIKDNNKSVHPDWEFTTEEKSLFTEISDTNLEKDMQRMNSGIIADDKELVDKDLQDLEIEDLPGHK